MRLSGFIVFPLLVLTAPTFVSAQETPTERDAARSVVQKLDQLERSLDVTALVTRLTGPSAARDAVAARAKQLMDTELLALGDDITRHPEIGFEETRSVQLLTDYLRKHDFDVQMGSGGLKTAFVARYTKSSGSPNLGIILEYDALRGTKGAFHGDQHSTQGPIGIAAAVAIAEYLTRTKTPGTVVVFGAPGEEVIHLFNNIDAIRSNLRPEARIQGVITEGGAAPNVVPDKTAADFYVRYPDEVYLAQETEMIDNAARAAALATGTQVKIDHYG